MKASVQVLIILYLVAIIACKPSPQKAENYYTDINDILYEVLVKEDLLIELVNSNMLKDSANNNISSNDKSENIKKMILAYENLKLQVASSLNKLKALHRFDNKIPLREAAVDLLNTYEKICNQEYAALLELVKKPDSLYSIEDDQNFFNIADSIDGKLQRKIDVYTSTSKLFAMEYNFKLTTDTNQIINQ